jgi:hypothetical protein
VHRIQVQARKRVYRARRPCALGHSERDACQRRDATCGTTRPLDES